LAGTTLDSTLIDKDIVVYIYSFKNKKLINIIDELITKSSSNSNIKIFIYDQNNLNRKKFFDKYKNVFYKHIKWDDIKGPIFYRKEVLKYVQKYYLEINNITNIVNLWDLLLVKYIEQYDIISGKNVKVLTSNNFYVDVKDKISLDKTNSKWIDTNFIFTKKNNLEIFNYAINLKGNIEELLLSIDCFNKNKLILSLPNNFYKVEQQDNEYVPYSKFHNYNLLIDEINKMQYINFEKYYNIKVDKIKKVSYDLNDVAYNDFKYELDSLQKTRFHVNLNTIKIV
jgi:hypothetical protein